MQHFKFKNWRIGEFDFWCHEQVNTYSTNIVQIENTFWDLAAFITIESKGTFGSIYYKALTNGTFPGRISLTWTSSRTSPSWNMKKESYLLFAVIWRDLFLSFFPRFLRQSWINGYPNKCRKNRQIMYLIVFSPKHFYQTKTLLKIHKKRNSFFVVAF